jgi:hypothetical protein
MSGRPRRKRLLVGAAVLLVAGAIAWRVLHLSDLMHIGAGYVAEQTCSCLFVSGRSAESCRGDLEPLAQKLVRFTAGDGEVTARAFFISSATARYQKGFGCTLQN